MIQVLKGEIYRACRAKSGSNDRGSWELVAIADEKNSKRTMTLFVRNGPTGIREGQMFRVTDIVEVKYGWKRDQDQQWKPDVTLGVNIEPIASEIDEVDDGELPWKDMDDDWQLPL